jgi:transposase
MDVSRQQLAVQFVTQGYSLAMAAEAMGASKDQVRSACKKLGVKPAGRGAAVKKRMGAPKKPLDPKVAQALLDVANGHASLSSAALRHGITLSRLAGHARRQGIKSKFAVKS